MNKEKIIRELLNVDYEEYNKGLIELIKVEKNSTTCEMGIGIVFKIKDPSMFLERYGVPIISDGGLFENDPDYNNKFLKLPNIIKESLLEKGFYEMYRCPLKTKNNEPSVFVLYNNIKIRYVMEYKDYLNTNMSEDRFKYNTDNLYLLEFEIIDDSVMYMSNND